MANNGEVDFIEAGSGPPIVLVHSSVSGARQWRRLMEALAPRFHVRAPNLIGYGRTPAWTNERPQSLEDQARLVEAVIPEGAQSIILAGHSFGATVAMKASLRLGGLVERLILLEPNPFFLLREQGRGEALGEILQLGENLRHLIDQGDWPAASERFADYWGGAGTWETYAPDRRAAFTEAFKPNVHEWDAVLGETTPLSDWVAGLPRKTFVVYDPATVRPIREILEILRSATDWTFQPIPEGGHMAPLTRPDIVNPIIEEFLED